MGESVTILEEVTDADEIARFRKSRQQHQMNDQVFRQLMEHIYEECRGKVVVVAGQELFAAETAEEAWRWARERHAEDSAPLVQYIPKEKAWRIYANRGGMVRMQ